MDCAHNAFGDIGECGTGELRRDGARQDARADQEQSLLPEHPERDRETPRKSQHRRAAPEVAARSRRASAWRQRNADRHRPSTHLRLARDHLSEPRRRAEDQRQQRDKAAVLMQQRNQPPAAPQRLQEMIEMQQRRVGILRQWPKSAINAGIKSARAVPRRRRRAGCDIAPVTQCFNMSAAASGCLKPSPASCSTSAGSSGPRAKSGAGRPGARAASPSNSCYSEFARAADGAPAHGQRHRGRQSPGSARSAPSRRPLPAAYGSARRRSSAGDARPAAETDRPRRGRRARSRAIQPPSASRSSAASVGAHAEFRMAAAGNQLLGLDEKLDLADAAAAELDVVAFDRDVAVPAKRHGSAASSRECRRGRRNRDSGARRTARARREALSPAATSPAHGRALIIAARSQFWPSRS